MTDSQTILGRKERDSSHLTLYRTTAPAIMRPSRGCEIALNSRRVQPPVPGHVYYSPLYAPALPAGLGSKPLERRKNPTNLLLRNFPDGGLHNHVGNQMPSLHTVLVWVHPCSRRNKVGSQPIARSVWVASAPCRAPPRPWEVWWAVKGALMPFLRPTAKLRQEPWLAGRLSAPGKCIGNSKGGGRQPSPEG